MSASATFLAAIVVILLASRLLGEAAQRLGQPAVIGQLFAGILLGPSFLGLVWPDAEHLLFPPGASQKTMLDGVADFGVLLLLLLTGMDTDVGLVRRIGAPAVSVSVMGVGVPLVFGVALGLGLPTALLPDSGRRLISALFLGVALAISSIKILAMVVRDMNFARRDLGQIIISASILEDSLGWLLIAVVFAFAGASADGAASLAARFAALALFVAASLTIGRRLVAWAIRIVNDHFVGEYAVVTLILVLMGAMALITDGLGVQTVLGAFLAGVLVGQSPILTKRIAAQLRGMVASFFAPIFFALAGLNSDLTMLKSPEMAAWTLALVLVASLGKFSGAFIGGWIGRLSRPESLALAIGMNARGSTEVIIASIGLANGALSPKLYSMIVAMAAVTTCAMPPTLRWALARVPCRPGERERLEREAFEAKGFVTNMERFLIVADEQANGRFAARLAGLLAGARGQPATMLHAKPGAGATADGAPVAAAVQRGAESARQTRPAEEPADRNVAVKVRSEATPMAQMLSDEAPKGYDFLIIGLDPATAPNGGFNAEIAAAARSFEGPVAIVVARGRHERAPLGAPLKILAPITGTATSQRAAEVAVELARASGCELSILVMTGDDFIHASGGRRRAAANLHEEEVVKDIVGRADLRDQAVRVRTASAGPWPRAILREAEGDDATLIVLGVSRRPGEALPLGETADRLLETSPRSLLFIAS
ncbi:MAG TPA: cation:proton antiporter [Roseiarcus sp.]|jgi:Kef-type K+ transport system membrane component KefB/nucleotide-binding universal stress UspA family protein